MAIQSVFTVSCDGCGCSYPRTSTDRDALVAEVVAHDWDVTAERVECPECAPVVENYPAHVRHDMAAQKYRVRVARRDGVQVGSMPAELGMELESGVVVKVNAKSIHVRHRGGGTFVMNGAHTPTIPTREAFKFGFPRP